MPQVHFPTEARIARVPLVDRDQLLELGQVLDEHFESLFKDRNQQLAEAKRQETRDIRRRFKDWSAEEIKKHTQEAHPEIESRYEYRYTRPTFRLELASGRTVEYANVQEMLDDPNITHELPKGLVARLECAGVEATLSIKGEFRTGIEIEISPSTSQPAALLRGALERWADQVCLPRYSYWWRESRFAVAILAAGLVIFSLWGAYVHHTTSVNPDAVLYQRSIVGEAKELLETGISEDNRDRALELLLAETAGVALPDVVGDPPVARTKLAWGWHQFVLLGYVCFLVVVAMLPPSTAVAVGRGITRVRRQRAWVWWVTRIAIGGLALSVAYAVFVSAFTASVGI